MKVMILPLVGIEWDGKRITLGMSEEEIRSVLGEPYDVDENNPLFYLPNIKKLYYCENELRFDMNSNDELEFIEFLGGVGGKFQPEIYGVSAFSSNADELLDILTHNNNADIIDNENGYSYAFPNIGIGIYRDRTPGDIDEMVKEAKEEGEPLSEEDYNFEMSRANHFAAIGLGNKDYYR